MRRNTQNTGGLNLLGQLFRTATARKDKRKPASSRQGNGPRGLSGRYYEVKDDLKLQGGKGKDLAPEEKYPLPALTEEAKHSASATVLPEDLKSPVAQERDENEEAIWQDAVADFEDAYGARSEKEETWYTCLAVERGNHYAEYDSDSGVLRDTWELPEDQDYFQQVDIIGPLVLKNTARMTQNQPDVDFSGVTKAERDKEAARLSRVIWSDFYRRCRIRDKVRSIAYGMQVTSTHFLKIGWDYTAKAAVPILEVNPETGMLEIQGSEDVRIGNITGELCLPFEIFLDPEARDWDDVRYIIHAKLRPLSYLQERYGDAAYDIQPTSRGNGLYDYESRLAAITGDTGRGSWSNGGTGGISGLGTGTGGRGTRGRRRSHVLTLERYEKPSPKYPKGRLTVIAGDKVLHHDELPYELDCLPFAPFGYQEDFGSIWHRGLVKDLITPQKQVDSAYSHMMSRARNDKLTIMVPEGTFLRPDAYTSGRDYNEFRYKGVNKPEYQIPPTDWAKYESVIRLNMELAQDKAGVHDISQGKVPAGIRSGVALNVLLSADDTQITEAVAHLESGMVRTAEIVIGIARQMMTEPRLFGLDSYGQKEEIEQQVESFEAFKMGGRASVTLTAGSALPKSPAAQEDKVLSLFQLGALGQPGTPEATENLFDLLDDMTSDVVVERVVGRMREAQEQAALAAAQQEQLKAELAANGQQPAPDPAELERARTEGKLAAIDRQAELDSAQAETDAALEVEKEGARKALEVQAQQAMAQSQMMQQPTMGQPPMPPQQGMM